MSTTCSFVVGATVSVMVELNATIAIIVSGIVILFYVSLGGLYAVVYTDLFQAGTMVLGLVRPAYPSIFFPCISLHRRSLNTN